MRWWVGLVLLVGCDRVFQLDERQPIDAPPADVLPANCRVTDQLATSADTYLIDATPRGKRDIMIATSANPALMKFKLDRALLPGERVVAATLQLEIVDRADECAPTCGPCQPNTATHVSVYWNTWDWSQEAAIADMRDNSASWQQPFSVGTDDRSDVVLDDIELPPATASQLVIPIPMVAVAAVTADRWVNHDSTPPPSDRLAIQLRTDGVLAISSQERPDSSCNDGRGGATIRLTLCQP